MTAIKSSASTVENREITSILTALMVDRSLPLWSLEGWDATAGGFVERLDIEGRADRFTPRRVRVQARQISCFAKAAQLGWYSPGRDIGIKGLLCVRSMATSAD